MNQTTTTLHVIDAERHVIEPVTLWPEYLDPAFHDHLPTLSAPSYTVDPKNPNGGLVQLPPLLYMQGRPLLQQWTKEAQIEAARGDQRSVADVARGADPVAHLQAMDDTGVRQAFLCPSFTFVMVHRESVPAEPAAAIANAYNRWLFDYCAANPERLHGLGLVARQDPARMVEELHHIRSLGWKTVVMCPGLFQGRDLGHPDYEPFWDACETHGVNVFFHHGAHLEAPTVGTDRYQTHFGLLACSHYMEAQLAFLSLLESGVFERHPTLQFAFAEAGASWLLPWLWRLDEICYAALPGEVADKVTMKPSDYFRRQCWVTFEMEEPCLDRVVDLVGAERLLFGTDFPHPDHSHFDVCYVTGPESPFSEAHRRLVLWENPKNFFGL